ncbi:MAG: TonB-dependent receptor [Planctomycetota bacterium]
MSMLERAAPLALALLTFACVARGDCQPDPIISGASVVCAGNDGDGFVAGLGVTDIRLEVAADARVTSAGTVSSDIAIGLNDRSRLTNAGSIQIDGASQAQGIGVDLRGTDTVLITRGAVSATLSEADLLAFPARDTNRLAAIAVGETAAASAASLDLVGDIAVTHRGSGEAAALLIGDQADDTIVTLGVTDFSASTTLQISRLGGLTDAFGAPLAPTLSAGGGGELLATNPLNGVSRELDMGGAIVARAGAGRLDIVNRSALILSNDFATPALYLLAPRALVHNVEGFIANQGVDPLTFQPGIALAASGRGRLELQLANASSSGWSGDIVIADVHPLRWWAQERLGISGLDLTASQTGIRNSSVNATHAVIGNVYLGSGHHRWRFAPREFDGVIGSVLVDQRNLSGSATPGEARFDFAGATLTGGLVIRDVAGARNRVTVYPSGAIGTLATTTNAGDNEVRLASVLDSSGVRRGGALAADITGFDRLAVDALGFWSLNAGATYRFAASTTVAPGGRLQIDGALRTPIVALGADAVLLGGGRTSGDVRARGALVLPGQSNGFDVIDYAHPRLTLGGALHLDAASVLETRIFGAGGSGPDAPTNSATQVWVGASGTAERGALIRPVIDGTRVSNRESFRILHNVAGGPVFDRVPDVGVLDSALLDWRLVENRARDLVIVARPVPLARLPWRSQGGREAVAALLEYDGDDAFLPQLAGELQSISDADEVARAAEALRPDDNDAPLFAATHLLGRFVALADARLSMPASGDGPHVWMSGFGSHVNRDRRGAAVGFLLEDAGLAAGIDTSAGTRGRVGVALNYGTGNVRQGGERHGTGLELDSFAGLAYGAYQGDALSARAMAGAGLLRYDTRRLVRVVQFGDNLGAKHHGFDVVVQAEVARPLRLGADRLLEPYLALRYLHVAQDGYRESTILGGRETLGFDDIVNPPVFGDSARLDVSASSADSVGSVLGLRANLALPGAAGMAGEARLLLGARWRHEFAAPAYDTRASFVAGGPSFNIEGDGLPRDTGEFDATLVVADTRGQRLDLGYQAEVSSALLAHGGTLRYQRSFADDLPFALLELPLHALAGGGALLGGLCLTCAAGPANVETITVRGAREPATVGLLDGLELERRQIAGNVQTLDDDDIRHARVISVGELLGAKLQSVNINDYQGNPFQLDVSFRGFSAGPQLGTPQGLSVVLDGVRVNEAFGDVVNWDLIPLNAIASFDLFPGSNPLHGLNTLGGALVMRSRNGFDDPGVTASLQGGSWGRKHGQLSAGASHGVLAGFVALTGFDEDGWRDNSPSRVEQAFTRLDLRSGPLSASFSVLAAGNDLVGNGMVPTTLYEQDSSAVYTSPDETENDALTFNLAAAFDVTDALGVNARLYRRTSDRSGSGGDIYEAFEDLDSRFDAPAAPLAGFRGGHPLCQYPDANRDGVADWGLDQDGDGLVDAGTLNARPTEEDVNLGRFLHVEPLNGPRLADPGGTPLGQPGCAHDFWQASGPARRGIGTTSGLAAGTPIGLLNRTAIDQGAQGGALQFNWNSARHHLLLGASVDHQRARFVASQQLAGIDAEHRVFVDPSIDPIYAAAYKPLVNSNFAGFSNTASAFGSETLTLFERLHLNIAARYNHTRVKTTLGSRERSGGDEASRVNLHNFRNFDARPEFIVCGGATADTSPGRANVSEQGQFRRIGDVLGLPGFGRDNRRDLRPSREKFRYSSLNPSFGLSVDARKDLNVYANWSQGTRTPSVVELGCAYDGSFVDLDGVPNNGSLQIPRSMLDNTIACNLPTALSGDPFLPQIFARTTEFGARGTLEGGAWRWNASVYRTNLYDDIYLVGVNASSSFFDTIGKTRREGVELGLAGQVGRFGLRLGYGYNEATFQTTQFLLSADNSRALKRGEVGVGALIPFDPEYGYFDPRSGKPLRQDLGMIVVEPGDRMPGMPLHNLNATLEFQATARLLFGLGMAAHSGVYLRGNENNEHQPGDSYRVGDPLHPGPNTPVRSYDNPGRTNGYAVFRLNAEYRLRRGMVGFVQVNNLFNANYYSGGRLGVNPFSPSTHGAVGASGWNYNVDEWRYASFIAPGAPRAAWVGLEWRY